MATLRSLGAHQHSRLLALSTCATTCTSAARTVQENAVKKVSQL
jgi:hypothetical protein